MLSKGTKNQLIGMGIGYVVSAVILWAFVVKRGPTAHWMIPWGLTVGAVGGAVVLVAGWLHDKYVRDKHIK